jgi:hypothetical protein
MLYKLFRARISTYYFGNRSYYLYILAEDEEKAIEYIYKHESFKNDEDAEIDEIVQIAEDTKGII